MVLRNTLMFIPPGETDVIKIKIYSGADNDDAGLWNVDTNEVLLSLCRYNEFRNCKTQKEQANFFATLTRVSSALIS